MSTLQFPTNPVNGQIYPTNPALGEVQYQYDAAANTWRLLGAGGATGVIAGTYGSATEIPQFTVTSSGVLTFAQNFPVSSIVGTLQTVTDNGATTTNPIEIDINGSTAVGITILDSVLPINRTEIHPTYVKVENGYVSVEENNVEGIRMDGRGTPYIRIQRDGYITLGNGTSVFTETARINGADGSASFDGQVVVGDLTSNGRVRVFDSGTQVAEMSPTGSFFDFLRIGGLNYATNDAPSGYVMTTDGLGNLTLQPAPAVGASTLQGVTDNGNTTTNEIDFIDSSNNPVITIDPVTARITIFPIAVGQPGLFIDPSDITINGDTFTIQALGTNPASLNFDGVTGVDITTNLSTIPFVVKPGGSAVLTVTGATTNIGNALVASGLNYPTSDGTSGQVLSTDGNGNLTFSSVVQTVNTLQTVTDAGNTTTNSIIIEGAANLSWPLEVRASATQESIKIVGNLADNKSLMSFYDNAGGTAYSYLDSGPTYLVIGIGTGAPTISIDPTGTTFDNLVTVNDAMSVTGNVDGIYQIKTIGLGGISVNDVAGVQTAYVQGNTGNIFTTGSLEASGLSYPTIDGTAGQVLSTDGNGNLGWGSTSAGNLQTVTDNGSITTNPITTGGITANGTSFLLGPVNAESVQINTVTDILDLDAGFANVPNTIDFGSDMILFNLNDVNLGTSNRIVSGGRLILGTQGGLQGNRYYSELVVVEPGDGAGFPNTSYVTLGYGDGTQKLETTSTGITINGNLDVGAITASGVADIPSGVTIGAYDPVGATGQLNIGFDTFQLYNDGTDTYFQNTVNNQAGNVFIGSNDLTLQNFDGSIKIAEFTLQGDNIFYNNNTEAFRISATSSTFPNALTVGTDLTVTGSAFVTTDLSVDGALTASFLRYPTLDGTAGQVLTTDGTGSLTFQDLPASPAYTNGTYSGNLSVGETAPASGVYNINMTGASGNIDTVGAISSGSLSTTGNISGTALTLTGDISAANICSSGFVSANSLTATAGITGATVTTTGNISGADITSSGTFTGQALTLNGPNANTNFNMQGNACIAGGAVNGGCLAMDSDLTVGGSVFVTGLITNGVGTLCSGRVEAANVITTPGALCSTGSTRLYDTIAFICSATNNAHYFGGFTSTPGQFLQAGPPDSNGDVRMIWGDSVTVVPVPNSSTDPGNLGEVAIGNFFYWYTGSEWVRIAGSQF